MIAGVPLAVVGMVREAKIAQAAGLKAVGGAAVDYLSQQLELALASRCCGIVSFGLCGGLDPRLKVGDLMVATEVVAGNKRFPTDPFWTEKLLDAMPTARRVRLYGADAIVGDRAAKAALREATAVGAVDTESHRAAVFAHSWGLPFAVVRAVSDDADQTLPEAAVVGLRPDGRPNISAVLKALLARPGELPALIRTSREAGAAFGALRHARHLLGPGRGDWRRESR